MAKAPQVAVQITATDRFSATMAKFRGELAGVQGPARALGRTLSSASFLPNLGKPGAALQDFYGQSQRALSGLTALTPALAAVGGAASIAGLARMVSSFSEMGVTLQNNAQRVGTSVQGLNTLQGAARFVGLSADTATSALGGLHETLGGANFGRNPEAAAAFQQMGIAFRGAGMNARSAADALPEVANAVQRLIRGSGGDTRAAVTFLQRIGISPEALPLLARGADGLAALRTEYERLNPITAESIAANERFYRAQVQLDAASTSLGRTITTALEPALTPLLRELATWTSQHGTEIGDGFRAVATGIGSIALAAPGALSRMREFRSEAQSVLDIIRDAGRSVGADQIGEWLRRQQAATRANQVPMGQAPHGPSQYDAEVFGRLDPLQQSFYRTNAEGRERFNRQYAPDRYPGTAPSAPNGVPGTGPRFGPQNPGSNAPITPGSFQNRAPGVVERLMQDFQLSRNQAAGIVGNLGHESGLQAINERQPLIPNSRGGFGWAQWTADRRRAFEQWTADNRLDVRSDEANYGFLRHELANTRHGQTAIAAVRQTATPGAAAQAFYPFESGGDPRAISAMGSRIRFADQAAALHAQQAVAPPQPARPVAPAAPTPAIAAAANNNGASTVRIDVQHTNPPDGVRLKTDTEGEGVEMGTIRVRRAMPT